MDTFYLDLAAASQETARQFFNQAVKRKHPLARDMARKWAAQALEHMSTAIDAHVAAVGEEVSP